MIDAVVLPDTFQVKTPCTKCGSYYVQIDRCYNALCRADRADARKQHIIDIRTFSAPTKNFQKGKQPKGLHWDKKAHKVSR